jgi:hypothetical protein
MGQYNRDDPEHVARVQQQWRERTARRAARPVAMRGRRAAPIWLLAVGVAALLALLLLGLSALRQRAAIAPNRAAAADLPYSLPRAITAELPTPTKDPRPGLARAIVVSPTPTRPAGCPVMGAIEPGRLYSIRERNGAWLLLEVEGSGAVWTADKLPAAQGQARLDRAIVAYASPSLNGQPCAGLLGAIEPGRVYTVVEQRTGWTQLRIEGSGDVWTNEKL